MRVQPNFWEDEDEDEMVIVDNDKVITKGPNGIHFGDAKDPINEEDRKERFNMESKTIGLPIDDDKVITLGPNGIHIDDAKDPINEEDRKERFNMDDENDPFGDGSNGAFRNQRGKIKPIIKRKHKKRFGLTRKASKENTR